MLLSYYIVVVTMLEQNLGVIWLQMPTQERSSLDDIVLITTPQSSQDCC